MKFLQVIFSSWRWLKPSGGSAGEGRVDRVWRLPQSDAMQNKVSVMQCCSTERRLCCRVPYTSHCLPSRRCRRHLPSLRPAAPLRSVSLRVFNRPWAPAVRSRTRLAEAFPRFRRRMFSFCGVSERGGVHARFSCVSSQFLCNHFCHYFVHVFMAFPNIHITRTSDIFSLY